MAMITADIVQHICEHLTLFIDLSKLSCVNKCLKNQIHHSSDEHWLRIGRETCGKAHWNEELFAHILDRPDGRYTARLHMCPWLSVPERFQLRTLDAYRAMDTTMELRYLKVSALFNSQNGRRKPKAHPSTDQGRRHGVLGTA
jgi:hypothetical protein